MKLKDLFKRVPPSPEALEQRKKEQAAYKSSYNKARIQAMRKRGRQAGHIQQRGSHGVGHAVGIIGDVGLQMQSNLGNMFGYSSPRPTPRPKTHAQSHKQRTITINGKTYARTDKEQPKPVQRERSIWDFP